MATDALAARVDRLARQYGHRASVDTGRVVIVALNARGQQVTAISCGCPPRRIVLAPDGGALAMWVEEHGDGCVPAPSRARASDHATLERRTRAALTYVEHELRRRR